MKKDLKYLLFIMFAFLLIGNRPDYITFSDFYDSDTAKITEAIKDQTGGDYDNNLIAARDSVTAEVGG